MVKFTPQENRQKDKGEQFTEVATEKKVTGRPKKEIDKETFEKLCDLQCTIEDLADFFSCSHDTIQRWCTNEYGESFACIHKKHLAKGKASLRRNMFRLSEKNATMAIFLAKNYLGMTDNLEVKADTSLMSALLDVVKGEQK